MYELTFQILIHYHTVNYLLNQVDACWKKRWGFIYGTPACLIFKLITSKQTNGNYSWSRYLYKFIFNIEYYFFREVEEVKKTKHVDDEQPEDDVDENVKNGDDKAEENGDDKETEADGKTEGKNNYL